MSRPIGRPPGRKYTVSLHLMVSPAQQRKLDRLCKRAGVSQSEAVRVLIDATDRR